MRLYLSVLCALSVAGVASVSAQTTPPNLTYAYQGPTDPKPITVGVTGVIPFPATLAGQSSTVAFFITNVGATAVTVSQFATTSAAFSAANGTVTIFPNGGTGTISLVFSPTSSATVTGAFSFQIAAPDGTMSQANFQLSGVGQTAQLITSYILNPAGNQTTVGDGGTIPFPATTIGQTATATFVITNRGTGAGAVNGVLISPGAFSLAGLQLLPASVAAGNDFRFNVVFTPTTRGAVAGTLMVTLGTGAPITINLQGQGLAASFTYTLVSPSGNTTLNPSDTINFPGTPLGQTSTMALQVQNAGNSTGTITAITTVGADFQVNAGVPLPVTLASGATVVLTITYAPKNPGESAGTLLIDATLLNLHGTGQGANLTYSFQTAQGTTALQNNGVALFPNTSVGSNSQGKIVISNAGNQSGTVTSVTVTGAAFSLAQGPFSPLSIAAGGSASIPISFAPNAIGNITGTILIDAETLTLRGNGTTPQALSPFHFTGLSGTANPLTQPAVGLTLQTPYPLDLTGTLTLSFVSDSFVDDPTIQFSSGGRTVSFKIPANTTSAIFQSGSAQIQFQAGTVAGAIALTPTFSLATVDITPQPAASTTVRVPAVAPVITAVQVGAVTPTSFQVSITGYSTPRSLTSMDLQFASAPGQNLLTPTIHIDTSAAFSAWYQSTASQTTGSQFTATITINASGSTDAVQSLSVTATNGQGTSNTINANLR